MIARELNARIESGALKLQDGWDGIKSGFNFILGRQVINKFQINYRCNANPIN